MSSWVCKKCGGTERTSDGHCRTCERQRMRSTYEANKESWAAQTQAWKEANPDKWDETKERSRLKKYGLTPEQHQALFEAQDGLCHICKDPLTRRVHLDHDHVTNKIRGLLCHRCNVGLGHFRDRPDLLRAAAAYLETATTEYSVRRRAPNFRSDDRRFKVTESVRTEVHSLREQGLSLGSIASKVGLSRSWVQVILKSH
jgi:hypothetical protein